MQIVQWLFKVAHEQPAGENTATSNPGNKKEDASDHRRSKALVLFNRCGGGKWGLFPIFRRRDIAKTCFYSTLNLKRLRSFSRRQDLMKTKKDDIIGRGVGISSQKADASPVGNKVLPITDTTTPANTLSSSPNHAEKERPDKPKPKSSGEKTKTMSRMKELLRWAAAAKSERAGKYIGRKFRNRATLKVPDDDQLRNVDESPKISFRWEVESCSTSSSLYSRISDYPSLNSTSIHRQRDQITRRGNWITTDTEFVVLEL